MGTKITILRLVHSALVDTELDFVDVARHHHYTLERIDGGFKITHPATKRSACVPMSNVRQWSEEPDDASKPAEDAPKTKVRR